MIFNLFSKKSSTESKIDEIKKDYKLKDSLDKIKTLVTVEEKILLAKEIILTTPIVKMENALSQFDDEEWYLEPNHLKKYLEYKNPKSYFYKGIDCDVSILCMVMYCLLNNKFNVNNIINQYGSKHKFEIRDNGERYKGDTLTSALYLLKLYLGSLWKTIDGNPALQREKKYKAFYELFSSVARTGVPVAPNGDWNEYCYLHSEIIWRAMDTEAKEFLRCYFMFGNYMCIPGKSYQIGEKAWTSFNMARSNRGKWDTVDTLLVKIYGYFYYSDVSYLEAIFTDKKEELAAETMIWLNKYNGWQDFVDRNVLYSFVDKTNYIPVSLKTGSPIKINEAHNYDAIPKNHKEFLIFFKELSQRIVLRNDYIYSKIM